MSKTYLKRNRPSLWTFVAVNIAAFWGIVVWGADFSAIETAWASLSAKDGVAVMLAPVVVFVFNGLLPADAKARIVYLRWRNPLPGCRAFSVHLPAEVRADPQRLAERWGPFPTDAASQNQLWYDILKSVESELEVREAYRDSLLSRDLAAFAFLFLLLLGCASVLSGAAWAVKGVYLACLLAQCVGTVAAARNYGVRFVRTTLAVGSRVGGRTG